MGGCEVNVCCRRGTLRIRRPEGGNVAGLYFELEYQRRRKFSDLSQSRGCVKFVVEVLESALRWSVSSLGSLWWPRGFDGVAKFWLPL